MAYNKKNWQDNVSDITAAELNRMEQGIYDNSLIADAVTNKLNPRDTETYKTAELTEGQITDVIGVSNILIKGQTSQNGEPTPSSPVDINVVSGSNIVYTSNKNLFNPSNIIANTNIDANGNLVDANNINLYYISVISGEKYTMTRGQSRQWVYAFSKTTPNKGQQMNTRIVKTSTMETFTVPDGYNYIIVRQIETSGESINSLMILKGTYTTAPGYEPHQGKELPLDLPVENLINLSDGTNTTKNVTRVIQNGEIILNGTPSDTGYNNQIFTYTAKQTGEYMLLPFKSKKNPDIRLIYRVNEENYKSDDDYPLINLLKDDILTVILRITSTDPIVNFTMKPMLYIGSKANAYTPYGTDPIELCKIGNYQDYFYKSGSKWYLHKEIEKVVLNSTETWSGLTDLGDCIRVNTSFRCKYYQQFSDYFKYNDSYSLDEEHFYNYSNYFYVFLSKTKATTIEEFKTWLSNHNTTIYYVLETATDTEITDTTLISQLEAIYNAPLYEQTNITQTNNDLPMVLDITACKDNINGIKAFIRK